MSMNMGATAISRSSQPYAAETCVPDAYHFSKTQSTGTRFIMMLTAVASGVFAGRVMHSTMSIEMALTGLFVLLAFVGGLLSTWSPCGYSSLSLLRPAGR